MVVLAPNLQFAAQPVGEKIHLVLQTAVAVGNAFGMLQHNTPGFGQRQTAAAALEKLYLIAGFEFADMLAHSGLRNVKLLGAFGEIEGFGRRNENPQAEIVHSDLIQTALGGKLGYGSFEMLDGFPHRHKDLPPAALRWPPPLKYLRAKRSTSTPPRERSDTRINLCVATKIADSFIDLIVRG